MSYYTVLELKQDATQTAILSAYRSQALRFHPQRNPQADPQKFQQIAEAFLVLSDPEFRASYDRFGESGLRHITTQTQKGTQKLIFDGQNYCNLQKALDTFEHIFSTTDPFAAEYDSGISAFGAAPGLDETKWRPRPERKRKDPDLFVDLNLKLEELYFGCVKKRKVTRRLINADQTYSQREEIVEIQVKPGWKPLTEVRFKELGDEAPGVIPSDIVFVVKEEPHPIFKRQGDDLIVNLKISLLEALGGFTREIQTLDGRALHTDIQEIVQPGALKTIHGEGMPSEKGKGNMLVRFDVEFPKHVPEHSKKLLREVLKQCE
ncbi:Chaperone_protein DnaJ subfamily B [Hexamita inflata]|uniref:Chaperone protein DnaJ subfamily B n=1 Tax=Hexamita inflata TaxID=28002 RepID=A0AA86NS23_9EUKA|nr:Chaperone protein DnaJ subfamily B [Hexamita inflata]CAI9944932.1 Chaperone protein DnaJ subfamily B [Hexamita inflata]